MDAKTLACGLLVATLGVGMLGGCAGAPQKPEAEAQAEQEQAEPTVFDELLEASRTVGTDDAPGSAPMEFRTSLRAAAEALEAGDELPDTLADEWAVVEDAAVWVAENASMDATNYDNLLTLAEAAGTADGVRERLGDRIDEENKKAEAEEAARKEREAKEQAEREAAAALAAANTDTIDGFLQQQPFYCPSAHIAEQDPNYKALYPDMIMLDGPITNNSDKAVKDIDLYVGAWDGSGYAVRLEGRYSFSSTDTNVAIFTIEDANLKPGESWNEYGSYGWQLDEQISRKITYLRTIVMEVTFVDGTTWENPCLGQWLKIYQDRSFA